MDWFDRTSELREVEDEVGQDVKRTEEDRSVMSFWRKRGQTRSHQSEEKDIRNENEDKSMESD